MNQEQKEETIRLVNDGCKVLMSGPYVDGFASVYEGENGWMIESQVWASESLDKTNYHRLSFYKRVEPKV